MNESLALNVIGRVVAGGETYALHIDPEYAPALDGLQGFSHLAVIWWANLFDEPALRALRVCDSPYHGAPPQLGIFATRSPLRPNPLCHTVVAVVDIDPQAGAIIVPYIDAEDGTPLLDIKPYHPCTDRVRDVAVPAWCAGWPQWLEESATFDWTAVFDNAR